MNRPWKVEGITLSCFSSFTGFHSCYYRLSSTSQINDSNWETRQYHHVPIQCKEIWNIDLIIVSPLVLYPICFFYHKKLCRFRPLASCALVFWQAYLSSLPDTSETWGHVVFHWLTCCVKHFVMQHTEYAWIQPKCIHSTFSFLKLSSAKLVMIFSLDLNANLWEKNNFNQVFTCPKVVFLPFQNLFMLQLKTNIY